MLLGVLDMKSTRKHKIGELVRKINERNTLGLRNFCGLNINKEFMTTVADTNGVDESKYKIVRKNRFVFSGMQTGRDQCIRISMYTDENIAIISPAYTTFEMTNENLILPTYFFMLFLSKEKDRFGAFCSDASIRSNLERDRFCDIELEIPSIEIQRKYVSIYEGLLANLQSYESKLEDLKLIFEGYIEGLKRQYKPKKLKDYISQYKDINKSFKVTKLAGLFDGNIADPRSTSNQDNLSRYQIVYPTSIVYPPPHFGEIGTIGIVENEPVLLSPMYVAFKSKNEELLNLHYALLWFRRKTFMKYAFFTSCDSVRDTFDFNKICEYEIPIPSIEIQNNIVAIFNAYNKRKEFINKLKDIIKDICPILIKGSLDEARGVTHG